MKKGKKMKRKTLCKVRAISKRAVGAGFLKFPQAFNEMSLRRSDSRCQTHFSGRECSRMEGWRECEKKGREMREGEEGRKEGQRNTKEE